MTLKWKRSNNRNNKRTEIEWFDWFVKQIQTSMGFGWINEPSAEKTSCPKLALFPIRHCCFLHPYYCYTGYHCQGKVIDTKIRRKVKLFRNMIRFLFLMDKRTLETLSNSKYCSYSKDFLYNNWQNLVRASQKLKSQDVTSCYLSKHEVQCREHNIMYMSGDGGAYFVLGGLTSKCRRHWLVGGSGEFSARKFWNLEAQKCIFAIYHWLFTNWFIYLNLFALMLCSFCFVFPSVSFLFLCFMGFLIIFNFYLILNFYFLLEIGGALVPPALLSLHAALFISLYWRSCIFPPYLFTFVLLSSVW